MRTFGEGSHRQSLIGREFGFCQLSFRETPWCFTVDRHFSQLAANSSGQMDRQTKAVVLTTTQRALLRGFDSLVSLHESRLEVLRHPKSRPNVLRSIGSRSKVLRRRGLRLNKYTSSQGSTHFGAQSYHPKSLRSMGRFKKRCFASHNQSASAWR